MKKILLYFPFILIIHLNAQTPCNEWVSSFGGSTSDIGWLIARDDLGNVYISGEYTSPVIYFGNDTIFNNGNMDAYILKINPDGIPQWCFTVGGSNEDRPRGLCTDLEGNIISAGRFYSPTLTIGDSVFINHGGSDIYLFKLNSDGEVIWARSFGSDGTIEFGFQVDVDSENNIVMTGYYNGYSITFDNYILTNYEEGYDDMLVVKFDSSGNVLWARDAGGDNDDRGLRLTIDQSDNIYVSGHFGSSTMYMEPFSLVNTGSHDIFLAKYDSNGDEKWLKGVQGSGPDYPYDVAIDNFGSVYTTGYFESPFIKFDSHIIYNNGYIDLFLAKYDSLGNNVWARSFGGSGTDKAYDIDVDSLNNLYAIGYFTSSSI
ncbi:MAG: hypothetical protein NT175_14185, partial [Bacteroidetes bacterium]|nr:hypothetical protein [Bacteroidota bacterium]